MAGVAFRLLSLTVFCDGLQVVGAAIMRSVGAQVYGIVFDIVGFYLIGIPLGGYLMLKTSWTLRGIHRIVKFLYFTRAEKTMKLLHFSFYRILGWPDSGLFGHFRRTGHFHLQNQLGEGGRKGTQFVHEVQEEAATARGGEGREIR